MSVKTSSILSAIPIVAASILVANTAPAEASVLFGDGDELSIDFAVDFSGGVAPNSAILFQDIDGNFAPVDEFGNFGVLNTSTGAFAPFISNGTIDEDYQIRSFDFGLLPNIPGDPADTIDTNFLLDPLLNPTGEALTLGAKDDPTAVPFITLENGISDQDPDVEIFLNRIGFISTTDIGAGQNQTVVSGDIGLVSNSVDENGVPRPTAHGVGSFNGTFVIGDTDTSFSATFVVTEVKDVDVPEPASVLGLLAVGGTLVATKSSKRKQIS